MQPLCTASVGADLAAGPRDARGSFFTSNRIAATCGAHRKDVQGARFNHDGFITKDEITTLQAQFDERSAKSAPTRAAHLFEHLDADHDGKITQAEIDSSRAKRLATTGGTAKAGHRGGASLFARADANQDGVITRAEFDAAVAGDKIKLRHAGMRGSQIARLFDAADTDKNGRLSLDEAQRAALKNSTPPTPIMTAC